MIFYIIFGGLLFNSAFFFFGNTFDIFKLIRYVGTVFGLTIGHTLIVFLILSIIRFFKRQWPSFLIPSIIITTLTFIVIILANIDKYTELAEPQKQSKRDTYDDIDLFTDELIRRRREIPDFDANQFARDWVADKDAYIAKALSRKNEPGLDANRNQDIHKEQSTSPLYQEEEELSSQQTRAKAPKAAGGVRKGKPGGLGEFAIAVSRRRSLLNEAASRVAGRKGRRADIKSINDSINVLIKQLGEEFGANDETKSNIRRQIDILSTQRSNLFAGGGEILENLPETLRKRGKARGVAQLGYEEETISFQQKDEGVVQNTNRNITSTREINYSTLTTYQSGDHVHKVLKDHPDYINTADSQKFKEYVNNLPLQQLKTATRIKKSGTAEEIIQLISNYKSQEDYQESHRLMIKDVIENYSVFDKSRAINIVQDWINRVEDNAKVISLSVKDNSSGHYKQTYLVTYTIVRGSNQNEYMYDYNHNTNAIQRMVYLHDED